MTPLRQKMSDDLHCGTIPTGPSRHISDAFLISPATLVNHRMNWARHTFVNTNFTL